MAAITDFLQSLASVGFVVVGLFAVRLWWRARNRGNAYLALALGLLAAVTLVSEVQRDLGITRPDGTSAAPPAVAAVVGVLTLAMFLGCGYSLLLFRHHLVPVRREILAVVGTAMVVLSFSFVPFSLNPALVKRNLATVLLLLLVLLLVWAGSCAEPVYRLWRLSGTRPAVQRARLRALAAGYGLIILVLLLSVGVVSANPRQDTARYRESGSRLVLQLITLLAVPALYISFAPPRWLRRSWRASEEEAFNEALHDLLLDSPGTRVLADRAMTWAIRLVGAEGGVMLDVDGSILARQGLPLDLVSSVGNGPMPHHATAGRLSDGQAVIAVPLTLAAGTGRMVVLAGPLTPTLGDEESVRLSQYSVSVSAALDRMRLLEQVHQSQERLREMNRDLERRVSLRTSELERSNRELQSSNRELEAFSYTVSHDLRAPLRAIDGFARILGEEHADQLQPAARRYLELVTENARGMGSLIDTMLTFSRLGRQPLTLQEVDAAAIAQRVADRSLVDISHRKITVAVEPMPACHSDPMLVEQLYSNLVGNAVKFSRSRDEAVVTVGAQPDPEAPGVTAYFVRDNGVGFDPRYAHKLFGVFQRLHSGSEYEGFGAGLAIVERIVSRHGGRVWAETVEGEGATFYFTLTPASPVPEVSPVDAPSPSRPEGIT